MPWWVNLHAVKHLGQRQAVAKFGNARAVQTLMAKAKTRRNTQLQEGTDGTGFTVSDVDPDFDDSHSRVVKELK